MRQNFLFSVLSYNCDSGYPYCTCINVQSQMRENRLPYVPGGREFRNVIVTVKAFIQCFQFHHLSLAFLLLLLHDVCGMVMSDLSSLSFQFGICPFRVLCYLSLFQDKLFKSYSLSLSVIVSLCLYCFYCPSLVQPVAFQRRLNQNGLHIIFHSYLTHPNVIAVRAEGLPEPPVLQQPGPNLAGVQVG